MERIENCPKCGACLADVGTFTNFPVVKIECLNCGWTYVESEKEDA